jgi:hypothetical protein
VRRGLSARNSPFPARGESRANRKAIINYRRHRYADLSAIISRREGLSAHTCAASRALRSEELFRSREIGYINSQTLDRDIASLARLNGRSRNCTGWVTRAVTRECSRDLPLRELSIGSAQRNALGSVRLGFNRLFIPARIIGDHCACAVGATRGIDVINFTLASSLNLAAPAVVLRFLLTPAGLRGSKGAFIVRISRAGKYERFPLISCACEPIADQDKSGRDGRGVARRAASRGLKSSVFPRLIAEQRRGKEETSACSDVRD